MCYAYTRHVYSYEGVYYCDNCDTYMKYDAFTGLIANFLYAMALLRISCRAKGKKYTLHTKVGNKAWKAEKRGN